MGTQNWSLQGRRAAGKQKLLMYDRKKDVLAYVCGKTICEKKINSIDSTLKQK